MNRVGVSTRVIPETLSRHHTVRSGRRYGRSLGSGCTWRDKDAAITLALWPVSLVF
jgi:hypothetical protein